MDITGREILTQNSVAGTSCLCSPGFLSWCFWRPPSCYPGNQNSPFSRYKFCFRKGVSAFRWRYQRQIQLIVLALPGICAEPLNNLLILNYRTFRHEYGDFGARIGKEGRDSYRDHCFPRRLTLAPGGTVWPRFRSPWDSFLQEQSALGIWFLHLMISFNIHLWRVNRSVEMKTYGWINAWPIVSVVSCLKDKAVMGPWSPSAATEADTRPWWLKASSVILRAQSSKAGSSTSFFFLFFSSLFTCFYFILFFFPPSPTFANLFSPGQ